HTLPPPLPLTNYHPHHLYTLSLHDALPICSPGRSRRTRAPPAPRAAPLLRPPAPAPRRADRARARRARGRAEARSPTAARRPPRSEEHTSELQSRFDLVCRLLLEKKKKKAT